VENLVLAVVSLLTCGLLGGCESRDYAVYVSSEGEDLAFIVDLGAGRYGLSDGSWRVGAEESEFTHTLNVLAGDGFLYETVFRLSAPMDPTVARWGGAVMSCAAESDAGRGEARRVVCDFPGTGRRSAFELDARRGVVSFEAGCIQSGGRCIFRLVDGEGILAPGTTPPTASRRSASLAPAAR